MSWVQVVWPMLASASLTLGLIHALIWARQRSMPQHLAFAVAAISLAILCLLELQAIHARTPSELAGLLRWTHVPIAALVVSLVTFVHLSFGPKYLALAIAAVALRMAALALNFTTGANLNFASIAAVGRVEWAGGVVVSYPIGSPNPWVLVAQAGNLLLALYVFLVLTSALRSDSAAERRHAIIICGGWLLFIGLMMTAAILMTLNAIKTPFIGSASFLFVIVAMSYQLTTNLFESNRLAVELRNSELVRLKSIAELAQRREEVAHLSRVTMLGELSGSLAHELNQPLAAILSNAQAAQRMLQRNPEGLTEVREVLGDIVADDRRAGEIIRRLRSLLRKEPESRADIDVNDVLRESLRLMDHDLRSRGITVITDLAVALPPVTADRVQIEQVVLNLIFNACDALLAAESRRMTIRSQVTDGWVRVTVSDEGPGIPEADLERIFEPFQTTKLNGLGLGLAICRTIAASHLGRLWAQNNAPARGVGFHFDLPVSSARRRP